MQPIDNFSKPELEIEGENVKLKRTKNTLNNALMYHNCNCAKKDELSIKAHAHKSHMIL